MGAVGADARRPDRRPAVQQVGRDAGVKRRFGRRGCRSRRHANREPERPDPDRRRSADPRRCRSGADRAGEQLELLPGGRDVADELPGQPAAAAGAADLDALGAERPGGAVGSCRVTLPSASTRATCPRSSVRPRCAGSGPVHRAAARPRRASRRVIVISSRRSVAGACASPPATARARMPFKRHVVGDLGMGEDQEALVPDRLDHDIGDVVRARGSRRRHGPPTPPPPNSLLCAASCWC